jgi:hypothetical protein
MGYAISKAESSRKGVRNMSKKNRVWLTGLMVGLVTLMATPAFARGISMKNAGIGLWIFIVIGAAIVLLQLIPAGILFFSFVGTTSSMIFRHKPTEEEAKAEEEKIAVPGYETAPVKK